MLNRTGVCSWSLRAGTPEELVDRVHAAGLDAVQLDLAPLRRGAWDLARTRACLRDGGIEVLSGMMATKAEDYSSLESIRRTGGVRPDEHWKANRETAAVNAELARELGLELVTLHAGFLPESSGDPERVKLVARLRELVDIFARCGVRIAFETGQETAATLLAVLHELERPSAGVNFDPANMLLYGMGDPLEALAQLAPHVHQVHIKDALRAGVPGTWGREVPVGSGEVDWAVFFELMREHSLAVDLLIEREAGDQRVRDIRAARDLLGGFLPGAA